MKIKKTYSLAPLYLSNLLPKEGGENVNDKSYIFVYKQTMGVKCSSHCIRLVGNSQKAAKKNDIGIF